MAFFERYSNQSGDNSNNLIAGRDINIVVKGNPFLRNDLLALYKHIYKWHTNSERKLWIESYFGEDFAQSSFAKEYWDYVPNLKHVNDSSILVMDMMNTAYAVIYGKLAWSAMAQSEGQSLLSYAYQMILCVNDNSVDIFDKKSKNASNQTADQKIQTKYPQLAENKYYDVGGEVFLKETNRQFSAHAIIPPKLLGFKPIDQASALVNLILAEKLKIHEVILHKSGKLWIDFEVENLTGEPIEFLIPKGQVFENWEYKCQTQNLTSTQEHLFTLAPHARKRFSIEGWCLNQFFAYPNGGKGRITIYETIDKSINSQGAQWDSIDKNIKIVRENYPSLIPPEPPILNLKENITSETVVLPPIEASIWEKFEQQFTKFLKKYLKKIIIGVIGISFSAGFILYLYPILINWLAK